MVINNYAFLFLIGYGVFFSYFRDYGPIPLLIVFTLSLYSFLMNKLNEYNIYFFKKYLNFLIFSSIILFCSIFDLMPSSWTMEFDLMVAVRQYFFIFSLPIFTFVAYKFFKFNYFFITRNSLILLGGYFFLYFIITDGMNGLILSPFVNYSQIFMIIFFINFEKINNQFLKYLILIIILILSFFLFKEVSLQFLIFFIGVILITINLNRYIIHKFVILTFTIIPFFSLLIINNSLIPFDSNSMVRLVMWKDATQSLIDTFGLGVGFGTEWIKNEFYLIKSNWFLFDNYNTNDKFNVTTHNTFSDIFFRVGLIGLLLFLKFIMSLFNERIIKNSRLVSYLFLSILISLSTNPGFFSVNFFIGLSITFGFLLTIIEKDFKSIQS